MKKISILLAISLIQFSYHAFATLPPAFTSIMAAMKKPNEVHILELKNKSLAALPGDLEQLKNIEELDLSDNQLTEIPEVVYRMTNLKRLDLRGNKIVAVTAKIAALAQLEEFAISQSYGNMIADGKSLKTIDPALYALPHLKRLDLAYYGLSSIDGDLAQSTIEELYLSNNKLDKIPANIFQSRSLKVLDISYNAIATINGVAVANAPLEILKINNNSFKSIPTFISSLTMLKELDMSNNVLSKPVIDVKKINPLKHLASLSLSNINLTYIPDEIACMASLESLDVSKNKIGFIGESISGLIGIKNINLSSNHLSELPDGFTCLVNMTRVDLSHNEFTALPYAITALNKIEYIDVGDNSTMSEFAENLQALANVKAVNVKRTNINEFQIQRLTDTLPTCSFVY